MYQKPIPLSPLNGLPPVLSKNIRTLILGSFPGRESLAQRQYYAHPRNQFWHLLSKVLDDDLVSVDYETRLQRLLSYRIGLWDVITMCERVGSLDARIRKAVPNDFAKLKCECPLLTRVCFNGKVAGAYVARLADAGYQTLQLPSSSPAYASRTFEEKLSIWRNIVL